MSTQEFENYLKLMGKLLQLSRNQQDKIAGELRDHLQSRVAELEEDGFEHEAAVGQALEEFGDAAAMAKNFQTVVRLKRRRWMMRFATLSMAAMFLVAVLTMAMWPSNARFGSPETASANFGTFVDDTQSIAPTPVLSDATLRDQATDKILKKEATLQYDETPWSDVQYELSENFNVNFVLHQSARDDSLVADQACSINLKGIPLEKGLQILLREHNATFVVRHGIIAIISIDDASMPEFMRVKMYNCRSLIESIELSNESQFNSGGELLLDLVESMVDPDSWVEQGGNGSGTAKIVNGVLIVKQCQTAFGEIESLLTDLAFEVKSEIGFEASMQNPVNGKTSAERDENVEDRGGEETSQSGNVDPFGKSSQDDPFATDPFGSSSAESPAADPFADLKKDSSDPFQ